ncbi:MAG: Protoheme farnesyltransferase [Acidimicrobiia bacterium]|nr:Protoheme farnesyltransferase [Acidimicrobiia bacterium]
MAIGARPLVPSRLAPGGLMGHETLRRPTTRVAAYVALTKPRIIELLLITTVPPMVVAAGGLPSGWLVLFTMIGGGFAAGGANAINMVIDRDIDRLMPRTQGRPLVTGLLTAGEALRFALGLEVAAFVVLAFAANLLAASLAVTATAFYVFVYSLWLKRTTSHNIVIGGIAGCMPVLVGWAAVTNTLSWAPFVMFAVVFAWTPPHSWALASKYADDYRAASVPMLPVVVPMSEAADRMLWWTGGLVAVSLVLAPVAHLGWLYTGVAVALGAGFLFVGQRLRRAPTQAMSMRVFVYSITYVTLLFGSMALDVVVRHGV